MTASVSILITSISKKVPLIKAVRNAVDFLNLNCCNSDQSSPKIIDKIIGADSDFQCIGRYFVDDFWHIPIQETLSLEEVIGFCKKHHIAMIIPTRDNELIFFAKHLDELKSHGISCLISSPQTIDYCRNKLLFSEFLKKHGLPSIPTYKDLTKISGTTFVVKECYGAGAKTIGLNLSRVKATAWKEKLVKPIFQPYIRGIEYSIDIYVDRQGNPKGSIARERQLIKDGESQITASVKIPELEELCLKAAHVLNLYGHAVFQAIRDDSDHFHIIECNPRFGGASTLSVAMGLKSFLWFIQESLNIPLSPFIRSEKELKQVRFPEDIILSK